MAAKTPMSLHRRMTSMGQEAEHEQRCIAFAKYQVDEKLLSYAKKDAILMHPLPAHHGEEVEVGIIDRFRSVIFDQQKTACISSARCLRKSFK